MKMTLHAALMAGLLSVTPALAQGTGVPSKMSYQAIVTDDLGAPLAPDAAETYEITMRVFDAATAGTLIWSEKQLAEVFQGRFAMILGIGQEVPVAGGGFEPRPDLDTIFSGKERFTEITVLKSGADASTTKTLAPRQQMMATATAFRAKVAESLGTNNNTALTVLDSGNVGIGTAAPNGKLDVSGLVRVQDGSTPNAGRIALGNRGGGGYMDTGIFRGSPGSLAPGNTLNLASYQDIAFNASNAPAGSQLTRMFIRGSDGNVGIGTTGPAAKLHVFSTNAPTDTAVFARAGEPASHIHNGANGDVYWRSSSAAGKVILQDTGGNVGIGTSSPTQARLVVSGIGGLDNIPVHSYLNVNGVNGGGQGGAVANINGVSIKASDAVHASVFRALSDARIKNIVGRSDGEADLALLKQIEITDYTHKDVIGKGTASSKKVIAQQVEKVFPQAVAKTVDVIPDIYTKAPVEEGWITLATDLKKGERVRLISTTKDEIVEVLEVKEDRFRAEFDLEDEEALFVYGREVKDFRVVEYEAIAMLNVSATQELFRRLEAKDKEVEALKSRLNAMDEKMGKVLALLSADRSKATQPVSLTSEPVSK